MEDLHLLHPLLIPTTTTTATIASTAVASDDHDYKYYNNNNHNNNNNILVSSNCILLRVISVLLIGIISIWANYEASKGFKITIINEAADSPAGKRFTLLYVSNDKATRILLNQTIQQGMARIWLYNAADNAVFHHSNITTAPPISLINGMVEYIISILAGKGNSAAGGGRSGGYSACMPVEESDNNVCWKDRDPKAVAHFLNYCEGHREGFIRRLNQAMKNGWHNETLLLDCALGLPAKHLCASYKSSLLMYNIHSNSLDLDSTNIIPPCYLT
ncbi:uncharacterized protein LOC132310064 [Cornus florida]|uniref:uncharacterized protein LOC132310064 n=1 Tax=Cornus florida TaxID=4283 RepID=UPI0028964069|nr:uncharacterized protein LOC132310064 [Cornus florida]